ncbi:MAG: methyltransferase domain-containing protein [Phycisphaerales bacterium]|nr:methyltransferase domain-containing protein [Phycisphaerales bacterium]
MSDTTPREYVLGTDEAELARLGFQHRLWSDTAHALWQSAGIRPGMRVLDVGCGPGYASLELAQIVGASGAVVGVDESEPFLEFARARAALLGVSHTDFRVGDATDLASVGLPEATFDLVYARWVLCFVPDPEAVVRGLATLVRPGGRVAVQDYFNYQSLTLAPRREAFDRVIRAVVRSWRDRKGDPDVMARLPRLFREHGFRTDLLRPTKVLTRPGESMWHWPDSFWRSFLPRLEKMGYITAEERAGFEGAWAEASSDPDTFMLLPTVFDLVVAKD